MPENFVTVGSRQIALLKPKRDLTRATRQPGGKYYRAPIVPISAERWMEASNISSNRASVASPAGYLIEASHPLMASQSTANYVAPIPTEYLEAV